MTTDDKLRVAFNELVRQLDLAPAAPVGLDSSRRYRRDTKRSVWRPLLLAAVCLAVAGVGAMLLADAKPTAPAGDSTLSNLERLACTKQIVVGRTLSVVPGTEAGRVTVRFAVEEWIKPAAGPREVIFTDTPDPTVNGLFPAWDENLRRLLYVPSSPDDVIEQLIDRSGDGKGESGDLAVEIAGLKDELVQASNTKCPL